MYYIKTECDNCKGEGKVGFYRCQNRRIVLRCEECLLVWPTPLVVGLSINSYAYDFNTGLVGGIGDYIYGNNAGWANYEEIPLPWRQYVANPPHP